MNRDHIEDPDERTAIDELAGRLERQRPLPSPNFRGDLRRHLLSMMAEYSARPAGLRAMVAALSGSGTALLALAATGLAGVGPFAA